MTIAPGPPQLPNPPRPRRSRTLVCGNCLLKVRVDASPSGERCPRCDGLLDRGGENVVTDQAKGENP